MIRLVGMAALAIITAAPGFGKEQKKNNMATESSNIAATDTATFAAGCFWGVEATFRQIPGVVSTSVGYTGGTTKNPTYEQVCSKTTGHAEAVQVVYDPDRVSYDSLLKVFFENHDPTQYNRQGPDVGDQYRSAVFYHSDAQKVAAEKMIADLTAEKKFGDSIVTQVVKAGPYYKAEEYHQQYLEKRGLSTCGIKPH